MSWFHKCKDLLEDTSVVDVLAIQIGIFENTHGKPQVILMHKKLKAALVREVYQRFGREPKDTIIEPVWINAYPLFFRDLGDDYIKVQNNSTRKELTL